MLRRLLVWSLLATLTALAQEQPGAVYGHVMNSITGEAIAGAIVHLLVLRSTAGNRASRELQTTSSADGSFQLDGVVPGSYLIRADHTGFSTVGRGSFIEVAPGQSTGDERILLAPNSTLTGKVLYDTGAPVAGSHVIAIAQVTAGGRTVIEQRSSTDTAPGGSFTLRDLRPGNYFVVAEPALPKEVAPEKQKPVPSDAGDLVRTLFPKALNLEEASAVPITVGQSPTDVTIYLQRAITHHVRGKVMSDLPREGELKVDLRPHGAAGSDVLNFKGTIEKNGTFDIGGVPRGDYTLQLSSRRSFPLARQEVAVGPEDLNGIGLNILSPVTLDGAISVDGGTSSALPRVQIFVKHIEDRKTLGVSANADGTFSIPNLDPEPSLFRAVVATPGFYVKSIHLNQQDVKDKPVDLSEIGHGRLEVVLRPGTGEIDGTVQDAGNGSSVGIVAVPQQLAPDASNIVQRYSRADGTFVISNLEPGTYRLYAISGMEWALWQMPEFLQAVQSLGTTVDIAENQHQQVQLKEIPQDAIQQTSNQLGLTTQ
jgi:hypothetical protein